MPHFCCYCRDKADSAAIRAEVFPAHLAHIEVSLDHYMVAGPLKQGELTVGSMLVVKAEDAAAARAFLERDPYYAAGLWDSIVIDQFLGVAGDWVGGAAWKK